MLADLRVFQIAAKQEDLFHATCVKLRGTPYFSLSTCLRHLVISMSPHTFELHSFDKDVVLYSGEAAYLFLLRVASGLESRIIGETEILAQLRDAWQRFDAQPAAKQVLRPYMDKIFQDTKLIRSQHLQGVGGSSSYASAVRKLIQANSDDVFFIVGAGQLAEQMLTFFNSYRLFFWNRSRARAETLLQQLQATQTFNKGVQIVDDDQLPRAMLESNHLILCTPQDEVREQNWTATLSQFRTSASQPVLQSLTHLSGERLDLRHWAVHAKDCFDLSHVFSLQRQFDELRALAIAKAEAACQERAQMRFLADGISLVHGWEDLAFR